MRRVPERRVTAAVAAALTPALVALTAVAPARADDAVPTPTPAPVATQADPGATTPARTESGDAGFGSAAGELIGPVFDGIRVTAAFVISAPTAPTAPAEPAAQLEPGGGSGATPRAWTPPKDLRAPTALVPTTRPGGSGGSGARTKEEILWRAYASAAARVDASCHLPVMLLAAIGEVESSSLRGRRLDAGHDVVPPVRGPALSGGGYAAIRDSDGGRYDGDPVWDRAVGPMQFIPGTWRMWGADGNRDGVADPQNVEDAALAAARYLCAGGRDLSTRADLRAAVRSYNHSDRYVATVLGLVDAVTSGAEAGP